MIPMVSSIEEVRLCKKLIQEVSEELHAAHVPHVENLSFGIMLEVPSVAFMMEELCAEVDFFSIGTNDLTQYFLAADRENAKVADLYSSFHPAFIRLLKRIVDGAHAGGKWIGLCGELGENRIALPLLVGLGLDEISLAAPRVAATKLAIAKIKSSDCTALLTQALRCSTRESVMKLLADWPVQSDSSSMLAPELVIVGSESQTKEEVIREMVGALFSFGRAERPDLLEEAVWAREDTYSTGFGGGFAIPHCKTDEVSANSIVVLRLAQPVIWGSLDGEPVDIVIMMAIRARDHGKEHMKTLARLSRLVMRDEFRALLRQEQDPARIATILQENINPDQAVTAS
jgi:fructose-specific PTS system IIA-like component